MRTITIDNALYADAQAYAEERGMSVSALFERYIKRVLRPKANTISDKELKQLLKNNDLI